MEHDHLTIKVHEEHNPVFEFQTYLTRDGIFDQK